MSTTDATAAGEPRGMMQKVLDGIEKAGNKVPHPVMIFVYLIIGVIVLSAILSALGVGVTEQVLVPASPGVVELEYLGETSEPALVSVEPPSTDYVIEEVTITIRSLLSVEGIRFLFTSFVNNFA